jgi:hypothetical protein
VRRYFEVVVPGAVIDPAIESSPIVQRANERVEMSAIGPAANAVTQGGGAVGSADQPIATADSMDVDQPEGGTLNLLELRAPAVARAPIASVPPEPDAGDTDTSLVAVRLPNGSRLSRRCVVSPPSGPQERQIRSVMTKRSRLQMAQRQHVGPCVCVRRQGNGPRPWIFRAGSAHPCASRDG